MLVAGLAAPASAGAGVELISDGSFEAGSGGGYWSESNTGSNPLFCTSSTCSGAGSGPRTFSTWARFGGFDEGQTASLSQTVTVPAGVAELTFFLEIPSCDPAGTDTFVVEVDDTTTVFSTNNSAAACGATGYVEKDVTLDAYADGAPHKIEFRGDISGEGEGITSFMLDDVSLISLAFSSTSVFAVKTEDYIEALGSVSPYHSGIRMRVTLSQNTGAGFTRIATARPFLDGAGDYLTAFARPAGGGRCKVRATFPGDEHHLGSSAVDRTKC